MDIDTSFDHDSISGKIVACPYCAWVWCQRMMRDSRADLLRSLIGFYPWYCHSCGRRFYASKRAGSIPSWFLR